MRSIAGLVLWALALVPIQAAERGAVIGAVVDAGNLIYEVDSRRLDLDGLVSVLRERARKTGIRPSDDTAIVLVSRELTLGQIYTIRAALHAYGFLEIRYFAYDPEKTQLREFHFEAKTIPFTRAASELLHGGSTEK